MPNKYLKDYVESRNNKQTNYEKILSKVEGVSKMNFFKMKFTKVLATAIAMLVVIIGIPQVYAKIKWNIEFKEYQNRDYETGVGVIKDDDFTEEVQMDYVYQNGVKAKIDSLLVTDDTFKANVNFEFDENIVVPSKEFQFSYAVYDENNNIYGIYARTHKDEKKDKITPYIYEELGVKYNKHDIYSLDNHICDTDSIGNIEAYDRNIISEIVLETTREFPKSKKVFIRVFDLGYTMYDISNDEGNGRPVLNGVESFTISDSEWIFEIDVPEKFYERDTGYLTLNEEIPGANVSKLAVTEAGLVVVGEFEGINEIMELGDEMSPNEWTQRQYNLLYITDGEGNRYDSLNSRIEGKKNFISVKFGATKSIFEKSGLYLNYTNSSGRLYTVEIIEKK